MAGDFPVRAGLAAHVISRISLPSAESPRLKNCAYIGLVVCRGFLSNAESEDCYRWQTQSIARTREAMESYEWDGSCRHRS